MTICESKVGPPPASKLFSWKTCGFVCTTDHWDALPMKMKVEDANRILNALVDSVMENGDESETTYEAWDAVSLELTGKESDDV